jgi:hypothetical protein
LANFDPPPHKGEQEWERIREGDHKTGDFRPDWAIWDSDHHRDPRRRTAIALEYIAWVLGQINKKLNPPKSRRKTVTRTVKKG